jgi:hypothetical protein
MCSIESYGLRTLLTSSSPHCNKSSNCCLATSLQHDKMPPLKVKATTMAIAFKPVLACGLLLMNPLLVKAQYAPCTVCPNGDPITLPEKALNLPGFELVDTCGALDSAVGVFFQSDDDGCALVHLVSSICGCPIPDGACYLCGENSSVQQPDRKVPYFLDFDGVSPNCEFVEAYLHSISETDSVCGGTYAFTASYCGCPNSPPIEGPMCTLCPRGEAVPDTNRTLSVQGIPFETCGEAEQATALYLSQGSDICNSFQSISPLCGCEASSTVKSPCSMCLDGTSVPLPDVDLSHLLLGSSLTGDDLTCGVIEDVSRSFEEESQECIDAQSLAGVCGCPPIENACDFCPGEDVGFPDKEVLLALKIIDVVPTCSQVDAFVTQLKGSSKLCYLAQSVNYVCGCNGGEKDYLGAQTHAQKVALAWVPRISAFLSICGSLMIIYDVLRDQTKRSSVFHTLMVAMSVFDIFGSIAWGLTTLPIPEYEYGETSGMYGAKGNEATCKMQGFLFQLGFTSMFYNVSLSFYFLMVVCYGMRESQLKKLQLWLHIPGLVVGFALAFGGIPWYENDLWGCYIPPPPLVEDYLVIVIFGVIPKCISIAIATVNTGLVYWAVRKQMIAASKWTITSRVRLEPSSSSVANAGPSGVLSMNPDACDLSGQPRRRESTRKSVIQTMERQTFRRALFYLGAFYLTVPVPLVANFNETAGTSYPYMLAAFTLAPLQGFFNFLLYAQPRILKALKERRQARQRALRRVQQDSNDASDSISTSKNAHGSSPSVDLGNIASIPELKETEEDHGPELGRSFVRPDVAARLHLKEDFGR